jgi:hypothetical protein
LAGELAAGELESSGGWITPRRRPRLFLIGRYGGGCGGGCGSIRRLTREFGRRPFRVLRLLESFGGVFHRQPGMLLSGDVIAFTVVHRGSLMSVGGKVVQLGGPLVWIVWHM